MSATIEPRSPLRLPISAPDQGLTLPPGEPRSRLGELALRRFNGRVELRADDWLVELLLVGGQPAAAALAGPGVDPPLHGRAALQALLDHATIPWTCRLEPLADPLPRALTGLAEAAQPLPVDGSGGLRAVLRGLVERRAAGVLELHSGLRWARAVLGQGQLLGSYADASPRLTASLEPLGGLLGGPPPELAWYPAVEAPPLSLPTEPTGAEAPNPELERQVIWIVSRFEGAWGRARERGNLLFGLQQALAEMLEATQMLARELEREQPDLAALDEELATLTAADRQPPSLAELDFRLAELPPAEACPRLVELVVQALHRVAQSNLGSSLADFCRQATASLEDEVRATLAPTAGQVDGNRSER